MRIKTLILIGGFLLSSAAHATQLPYATISPLIDTQLPTNQNGLISAPALRGVLHNMLDSVPVTGAIYPGPQSGASYTYQTLDQASDYTFTATAAAVTLQKPVTIPTTAAQIGRGWWAIVTASAGSTITVTPTGSTINGNSTLPISPGSSAIISTDGLNYFAVPLPPTGGSGGSGVVGSGVAPQFGYYASSGTTISGMTLINPLLGPNVNNVVAYGADPTGSVDATTAINAAITAALAGATGGPIYLPCGRYKVSSPFISAAIPLHKAFSLFGGGSDCTTIFTATGSPIAITLADPVSSTFHLRDFTLATQAVNVGTGISISTTTFALQQLGVGNDISNVTVRGDDSITGASPFHTDYFAVDVALTGGVSNVNVPNFSDPGNGAVGGIAFQLVGDAANSNYGILYNFVNPQIYYKNIGIAAGNWIQGLQITNPNMVGVNDGVLVNGSSGQFFGLEITGGQFACKGVCLQSTVAVGGVNVNSSSFIPIANNALTIAMECQGCSFTNNYFVNAGGFTGTSAIVTTNGTNGVAITGNTYIGGFNVANLMQATSQNVNVQSNVYNGPTFPNSPASSTGSIKIGTGSP